MSSKCKHQNFLSTVTINRLEDSGHFIADVRISCNDCGEPFRFLGLPFGVDLGGASVSTDGEEARLAIGTRETIQNIHDIKCGGFTMRKNIP